MLKDEGGLISANGSVCDCRCEEMAPPPPRGAGAAWPLSRNLMTKAHGAHALRAAAQPSARLRRPAPDRHANASVGAHELFTRAYMYVHYKRRGPLTSSWRSMSSTERIRR